MKKKWGLYPRLTCHSVGTLRPGSGLSSFFHFSRYRGLNLTAFSSQIKNGYSVLIREARGSDASKILEFIDTISSESDFLTFGQGEFIMSVEQEKEFLDKIAKQNNALFIVAEIDSKIIGTASFSGGARPRILHIGELSVSVLKEYWGNGIGTELIKYMIDWCKQSGVIRKINLIVRDDN
ncbi:MAG: GNAT family N-acetyltransferase, partial [Petrimonas sp.]|nr:GNAT family N-acetyltransferase [Petrimonas sp.]